MNMDPAQITKNVGAAVLIGSIMTLAILRIIDGKDALNAITTVGGVFLGGTALLGSAKAWATRQSDGAVQTKKEDGK
jgi:hypothetical protein